MAARVEMVPEGAVTAMMEESPKVAAGVAGRAMAATGKPGAVETVQVVVKRAAGEVAEAAQAIAIMVMALAREAVTPGKPITVVVAEAMETGAEPQVVRAARGAVV